MDKCTGIAVHMKLEEFRLDGKYSDVDILVQDRKFSCHRVLLAAASPYFDAMFGGKFREGNAKEITINDIDAESLEQILQYAYTGRGPTLVEGNVSRLLRTCEFLQVTRIRASCIEYILANVYNFSIENVLEIYFLARAFNIFSLGNILSHYLSGNFNTLSQKDAFLEMPFEDLFAVVKNYKCSTSLIIFKNENFLLDTLVRWLHYSYSERKDRFEKLVAMIDFERISAEYVDFMIREYKMPRELIHLKKESILDTYILSNDRQNPNKVIPTSYRDYQYSRNDVSLHLHVSTFSRKLRAKKIFSINEYAPDGFISCAQNPNMDNVVTIIPDKEGYMYCLEMFQERSLTFRAYPSVNLSNLDSIELSCPPVNRPLVGAYEKERDTMYFYTKMSSVGRRQDIYLKRAPNLELYDGHIDEDLHWGMFEYDCEIDKWFPISEGGFLRKTSAALVTNCGLLYLIGGSHQRCTCRYLDSRRVVQAYDHRTWKWQQLPPTNYEYIDAEACSLNGKIYVSNGESFEVFDPIAGKWELIRTGMCGKSCNFIVPYENSLWMCMYGNDRFYCVTVYEPNTRQWHAPPASLSHSSIEAKCFPGQDYFEIHEAFVFKSG